MPNSEALTQFRNYGEIVPAVTLLEDRCTPRSLLLLSPGGDDYRFWRALFPRARILVYTVQDWDIGHPPPPSIGTFDLCVAQNVFMYARQPADWFAHLSKVGRYLLVQDLVYRRRSTSPPYLGEDGDAVRYDLGARSDPAQPTFDLSGLGIETLRFDRYTGYRNTFHTDQDLPVHFVWLGDTRLEVPDTEQHFGLRRKLYDLAARAFVSPTALRYYKSARRILSGVF